MLAVTFYDVVVAIHVMAIVMAFGGMFAYPLALSYVQRRHPTALPALHETQRQINRLVISPYALIALIAGAYLASDRDLWSEVWVTVPVVILAIVMGLVGGFLTPREKVLAELARRDVDAGEQSTLSNEYRQLASRVLAVAVTAGLLVLVAVFFMVVKP